MTTPSLATRQCGGRWATASGVVPCRNPATGTITYGCIHEHVCTEAACGECLARVRRLTAGGNFICTECEDGPEPRICLVTARED